jgi:hypothetical protein
MNQKTMEHDKRNELDSAAAELELVIQRMAEHENDEREKLSKRYTRTEDEARAYDAGFVDGLEVGRQKGYAEGWDAALIQSSKEQKEKEKKEEEKEERESD